MNDHAGWTHDGRCVRCDSNDSGTECVKRRPSWDEYFEDVAKVVASRATCDRLHVGCVLVRDRRIVSTGFNGAPSGAQHCDDVGHLLENNHCVRTVHAEANAIAQAARHGVSVEGCVAYVTHRPCKACSLLLASAGIWDVRFGQEYPR